MSDCKASGGEGLLRHVVCFQFHEGVTEEQVSQVEQEFLALGSKIEQVASLEWGHNCSSEGLNQGCTHCFLLTFHSEGDRDGYLVHPAHLEFVQLVRAHIKTLFVVDYWAHQGVTSTP